MVPDNVWNIVAQISHVLGGCIISLLPVYFMGNGSLKFSIPIFLGIAALKEFWFDYRFETPDERGSSLLDFTMYCVGILFTLIFVHLHG